ncbi:uncharacterized protein LOC130514741 [Takifugu flavidus]|uniref:uncharacterized protein LOC130514741 n=1 Tax=Takifugu flavidus TaxID=433684 RepID=UPI002544B8F2|nr:uncharacterized protein LOC130514741 [Takifugu flavidus]
MRSKRADTAKKDPIRKGGNMVSPMWLSFTVSQQDHRIASCNTCGATFPRWGKKRKSFYTMKMLNHLRGFHGVKIRRERQKELLGKAKVRSANADEEMAEENEGKQLTPSMSLNKEEKEHWTVTCGDKTGVLHLSKLRRAMECIRCEDQWFAPMAFEEFGGKRSYKKWKRSIFYENKPLEYWFKQGVLVTKGFKVTKSSLGCLKETTNLPSDSSSEDFAEDNSTAPIDILDTEAAEAPDCRSHSDSVTTDAHSTQSSWCEPLDADVLIEGDPQPIKEPSNPTAEDLNYSAHDVAGEVELTHNPEEEDGELGEIQGATGSDPSAPSTTAPEDPDGITTTNSQATQVENENEERLTSPEKTTACNFPESLQTSSPSLPTGSDLDAMELVQLRKERLKLQIKVLRLQEQYYTRRLGPPM